MRLKLQNIGIIESADINIDGITLIAGQNDSGKSTVGKVLYAVIKGFNQDPNHFQEENNGMIMYHYQNILKELKKNYSDDITQYQTKEINEKWILKIEDLINKEAVPEEIKKPIIDKLFFLKLYLKNEFNSVDHKKSEIQSWLNSEMRTLFNLFRNEQESTINIDDLEGNATINSWFSGKENFFIKLDKNIETYYKEAYFIESPLIIDEALQRFVGQDNFKIYNRSRHEELAKSLSNQLPTNSVDYSTIIKQISKIIDGEIAVDLLEGVRFIKNNQDIAIKNTAVGIKSFGLIQLLLKNNRLNSRSLLIIDEPEVHLHPTWQVKYAEILVILSKEFDVPIVLTSHSPYFIEALEAFTKKYSYEKSTNFYFAEKSLDGLSSKITDVSEDISPILSSISEAFYTIQDINDED